jgi:hypothetical protein
MNMQKKNYLWLGLSVLTLIFFIISTMAFGFQGANGGSRMDLTDLGKLVDGSLAAGVPAFYTDSYGLMVSGLVFAGLTVGLAIVMTVLNTDNVNLKNKQSTISIMQWSVAFLLLLSFILTFSGELLFLLKNLDGTNLNFGDVWDKGNTAGLLIFTLLPLPLLAVPFCIKTK